MAEFLLDNTRRSSSLPRPFLPSGTEEGPPSSTWAVPRWLSPMVPDRHTGSRTGPRSVLPWYLRPAPCRHHPVRSHRLRRIRDRRSNRPPRGEAFARSCYRKRSGQSMAPKAVVSCVDIANGSLCDFLRAACCEDWDSGACRRRRRSPARCWTAWSANHQSSVVRMDGGATRRIPVGERNGTSARVEMACDRLL